MEGGRMRLSSISMVLITSIGMYNLSSVTAHFLYSGLRISELFGSNASKCLGKNDMTASSGCGAQLTAVWQVDPEENLEGQRFIALA
jgi:hypothetical protein